MWMRNGHDVVDMRRASPTTPALIVFFQEASSQIGVLVKFLPSKTIEMGSLGRAMFSVLKNSTTAIANRSTVATTEVLYRPQLRFSSINTQSPDIDFSSEESKRRLFNRILYRSKQRGFLELDLVLGKWVEDHIQSMDENGIKSLVHVLDLENPDLWKWLTSQEQPPNAVNSNPVFSALRDKVMSNLNNYSAPETRAVPGQPWVRGWDDIKKGRDGPVSGNQ